MFSTSPELPVVSKVGPGFENVTKSEVFAKNLARQGFIRAEFMQEEKIFRKEIGFIIRSQFLYVEKNFGRSRTSSRSEWKKGFH